MFQIFQSLFSLFRRDNDVPLAPPRDSESTMAPSANTLAGVNALLPSETASGHNISHNISTDNVNNVPTNNINPSNRNASRHTARSSRLENLKQVLNVLRAYVLTFGRPSSRLEMRAVIGAIVANLATVTIENQQLEQFMDEAIAAFDSLGMEASLVDVTSQMLAEQVAVWLQEQEATVGNVLSAYLQQFAPDDADWPMANLVKLAQTIVATLNDGSLSKSGGRALVERVVSAFDLDKALSQWVAPEWVGLAQRVASYMEKGELQSELHSVAWAYIQRFQSILSPQLIEQIIHTGPMNVSPAELLSGDLTDFSQMLYYKFQLLAADPVVTKSHEAIAADVKRAIVQLKARQGPDLDVTTGVLTGELEISSSLTGAVGSGDT
ncbi:MAG: hypothetical protein HC800_18810 [Phormidesmis sp. RL_2_1]|nr:hypothetical protein [Phormidesmis sp. RL_2_1]